MIFRARWIFLTILKCTFFMILVTKKCHYTLHLFDKNLNSLFLLNLKRMSESFVINCVLEKKLSTDCYSEDFQLNKTVSYCGICIYDIFSSLLITFLSTLLYQFLCSQNLSIRNGYSKKKKCNNYKIFTTHLI